MNIRVCLYRNERITAAYKGRRYTVEDLGIFLMDAAYFAAATFPSDLSRIASGDLAPIEASLGDRSYYYEAQHLAHICREDIPFEHPGDLVEAARLDALAEVLVPSLNRLFDLCGRVKIGAPVRAAQTPTRSSIPTLFLVAEVDPGNAPDLRRSVEKYSNGQLVVVTNATHITQDLVWTRADPSLFACSLSSAGSEMLGTGRKSVPVRDQVS